MQSDSSDDIYIVGVGMTPFGRFLDEPLSGLSKRAASNAIEDAHINSDQLNAIFFANAVQGAMEGQHGIRGQVALQDMQLNNIPIFNIENACASASTALNLAINYIRSGAAEIVMAVGAEKMASNNSRLTFEAFKGSLDVHHIDQTNKRLQNMGSETPTPAEEIDKESNRTIFMDVYASFAKYHMARFGTTQHQLAAVSAKNHNHSKYNALSQHRKTFTIDEVLNERLITWPFTLPMCSPVSDGAAAAIVCHKEALTKHQLKRAIKVRASVVMHGQRFTPDDIENHVSHLAAKKAYELGEMSSQDISVAEVHDATSFGEIQQTENLGFCSFGEGGHFAERGDSSLGGSIPVNTSGGLESKGHPIGATGLAQIFELVTQLRNEAGKRQVDGARLALAENGGGLIGIEEAAVCITILEGSNQHNKYV